MSQRECNGFRFRLNWRLSLFTLCFVPILCSLGLWQLNRADEKRQILAEWALKANLPAEAFIANAVDSYQYQSVIMTGAFFSDQYWLLEGRTLNGRSGYEVLMPFKLVTNEVVVVNRGWVPASADRRELPSLNYPKMQVALNGKVYIPSDTALIDERDNTLRHWPHRVVEINTDVMSEQFAGKIEPYVLRLDQNDPYAFEINWKPTNMPPEKHLGYAFQWFGLAFVLAILWFLTNSNALELIKRNNGKQ